MPPALRPPAGRNLGDLHGSCKWRRTGTSGGNGGRHARGSRARGDGGAVLPGPAHHDHGPPEGRDVLRDGVLPRSPAGRVRPRRSSPGPRAGLRRDPTRAPVRPGPAGPALRAHGADAGDRRHRPLRVRLLRREPAGGPRRRPLLREPSAGAPTPTSGRSTGPRTRRAAPSSTSWPRASSSSSGCFRRSPRRPGSEPPTRCYGSTSAGRRRAARARRRSWRSRASRRSPRPGARGTEGGATLEPR